jgi:predicted nucleic acid-binding protein
MPLEALSAVCRRRALGQISDSAFARISSLLKIDRERWDLLVVDNSVLHRAEAVLRDYGVKTLDAIYIASALLFQSGVGSRIAFISGDERQLSAAAACDLSVRPLRN